MIIFTKFQKDWTKIVGFLLIDKFLASANNFVTPSIYIPEDIEGPPGNYIQTSEPKRPAGDPDRIVEWPQPTQAPY